jgi:hypothetical protein
MESQEGNAQRAASARRRLCTRGDESGGSYGGDDSTSSGDCSGSTSWEERADVDVDPQFDRATVVDIDYDDDYSSHGDEVGRLFADNSNGNDEDSDAGASADTTISQPAQYTAWKEEHFTKMATIKQTSHLIRSVEVDSTCCGGGVDGDQVIADVRIVMAVRIMLSFPDLLTSVNKTLKAREEKKETKPKGSHS